MGNLADAEADARVGLETGPRPPGFNAARALAVLLETLAERGELDAAEAANERYRLAAGDLFTRVRSRSPATPWRSDAALAQLALGGQAEARAKRCARSSAPPRGWSTPAP
jgi:hypothetical protein